MTLSFHKTSLTINVLSSLVFPGISSALKVTFMPGLAHLCLFA